MTRPKIGVTVTSVAGVNYTVTDHAVGYRGQGKDPVFAVADGSNVTELLVREKDDTWSARELPDWLPVMAPEAKCRPIYRDPNPAKGGKGSKVLGRCQYPQCGADAVTRLAIAMDVNVAAIWCPEHYVKAVKWLDGLKKLHPEDRAEQIEALRQAVAS